MEPSGWPEFTVYKGGIMNTKTRHIISLNAFHIKLIALITMTLDHIGAYQTFTYSRSVNDGLRIIGRIAAPLFLFMVIEGMRHTHHQAKYILRLYSAGVIIEIINRIIENNTGTPGLGNTLPTFFYTALFIFCIEQIIKNRNNARAACAAGCGLAVPFLFYVLHVILAWQGYAAAWSMISIFCPSPMNINYSILFILMGIAWYFIDNRAINCAIFALLCLICRIVPVSVFFTTQCIWLRPVVFDTFQLFTEYQWLMCLAIPFMLLYNGEKGRSLKYLFYIYYPLHVYILYFIHLLKNT